MILVKLLKLVRPTRPGARAPQHEQPPQGDARTPQRRVAPMHHHQRKAAKTQHSPECINASILIILKKVIVES